MTQGNSIIVLSVITTLGGQGLQAHGQPPTPTQQIATISGCVSQAARTGSLADDTGAGIVATPSTAPVDANSAELVDAFLLTNATPSASPEAGKRTLPTSYALEGKEEDLSSTRVTASR